MDIRREALASVVAHRVPNNSILEEWDLPSLETHLRDDWDILVDLQASAQSDTLDPSDIVVQVLDSADTIYGQHVGALPDSVQEQMVGSTVLKAMDMWWQRHLTELDRLREGIHLRAYAQQDPKQIYKKEAFEMFQNMVHGLRMDTARSLQLSRVLFEIPHDGQEFESQSPILERMPSSV